MIDFSTAPPMSQDREKSFKMFLEGVHAFDYPHIVEIGVVRKPLDSPTLLSDGNSTSLFAWYIQKYHGTLSAVDINPENIEQCRNTLQSQGFSSPNIRLYTMDGLTLLKFERCIHGIYIDGVDWQEGNGSEQFHLDALKLAIPSLAPGALVLIDDVLDEHYKGKGKLAIPYALGNGFEKLYFGYQVLLRKE